MSRQKALSVWVVQIGENMRFSEGTVPMRTGSLVREMARRGHRVLWWTSAFDHFRKEWLRNGDTRSPMSDGVDVFYLRGCGYRRHISWKRFADHRILARKFRRFSMECVSPDVLLASSPPHDLAYATASFALMNRIPFVIDIRDPWPETFLQHCPATFKGLARFLLRGEFRMLKQAVRSASSVVAVSEEMLTWGLECAGRQRVDLDRVIELGFSRREASKEEVSPFLQSVAEDLRGKFVVLYLGAISGAYHNPITLVEAAKLSSSRNIHFVIAGDAGGLPTLRDQAAPLRNVTMTGWLNANEIDYVLERSHVGVCPSTVALNLPTNKFYAYLSAGLPVVSSFGGAIHELIETEGIGRNYEPGNAEDLLQCLISLMSDKAAYMDCAARAGRLFEKRFNGRKVSAEFADHLERVAGLDKDRTRPL